jgi:hypothetical protein
MKWALVALRHPWNPTTRRTILRSLKDGQLTLDQSAATTPGGGLTRHQAPIRSEPPLVVHRIHGLVTDADQAGSGNDTLWVSMNSRRPRMPISRPSPLLRNPPNGARSSRKAAPWLFTQV